MPIGYLAIDEMHRKRKNVRLTENFIKLVFYLGRFISTHRQMKHGTLWARISQNVKKPPLTVNVINFEFFGFNVSIWVPWSPLGPKKS